MKVRELYDEHRSLELSVELREAAVPALQQVLTYGVDAYVRCWNDAFESDVDLGPLMAYHVVLENLDACAVLASNCCSAAMASPLRNVFDTLLSLRYMAEDLSGRRSRAFAVADLQSRLTFLKSLDPATDEGKRAARDRKTDSIAKSIANDSFFRDRSLEIRTVEQYLRASALADAKLEWERTKALQNGKTPRWHSLFDGPKTRQALARTLGMSYQYETVYRQLSSVSHGEDLYRIIFRFHETGRRVVPIRDIGRLANYSSIGVSLAISAHEAILARYRPAEVKTNFLTWYGDVVHPLVARLRDLSLKTMGKRSW